MHVKELLTPATLFLLGERKRLAKDDKRFSPEDTLWATMIDRKIKQIYLKRNG